MQYNTTLQPENAKVFCNNTLHSDLVYHDLIFINETEKWLMECTVLKIKNHRGSNILNGYSLNALCLSQNNIQMSTRIELILIYMFNFTKL